MTVRRLSPAEGWLTVGLLVALVWANLRTVEAAGWSGRVDFAPALAVGGVLVGLLAAKSKLRSIWGLPLGLAVGLELLLIAHAVTGPAGSWRAQVEWLYAVLANWAGTVAREGATHDPVVFAVGVGWIGYVIGLCSSWLVFRLENGWWPLLINAAVGVIHLSYATVDSIPPYIASLFLGVLMVASLELHLRRSTWEASGVPVQRASAVWTLICAAGVAGLALFTANQLPSGEINQELATRYQDATEPWRDFQRQIDRLVGGARGQARPGSGLAFSDSLEPRGEFELGSEPLLQVRSPMPRYWRTSTYDLYDGRSMKSTVGGQRRYEPGQELPGAPDSARGRLSIEQVVTVLSPSANALFAAGEPRGFSVAVAVDQRAEGWDLAALRPASAIPRGQSYRAISAVSVASPCDLAEVRAPFEQWTDRYRELPVALPPRIGELTNRVVADARNPYERALAIEDYLRGMTYSTRTSVPPEDRDWVDYLLFDSRSGYCDYFATAMVVMLRTQDIPARVASGFASGGFDEQEQAWLVRESEAHSWVEVYFPGYGWIAFEPSAIRESPERGPSPQVAQDPDGAGSAAGPDEADLFDDLRRGNESAASGGSGAAGTATPVGVGLAAVALAMLGLGGLLGGLALTWDRGMANEPVARRRYGHLRRWLGWGRWRAEESATPYELVGRLSREFPELAEPAAALAHRHVEATYGPGPSPGSAEESESAWQQMRGPLAAAMLRHRFRGIWRRHP
jgi:transglutaminase-like putative cysteine protease